MFKTIKYPGIDSDEPTFSKMDYKINKIKFAPRRQKMFGKFNLPKY